MRGALFVSVFSVSSLDGNQVLVETAVNYLSSHENTNL